MMQVAEAEERGILQHQFRGWSYFNKQEINLTMIPGNTKEPQGTNTSTFKWKTG
jgi:hypothetical protein